MMKIINEEMLEKIDIASIIPKDEIETLIQFVENFINRFLETTDYDNLTDEIRIIHITTLLVQNKSTILPTLHDLDILHNDSSSWNFHFYASILIGEWLQSELNKLKNNEVDYENMIRRKNEKIVWKKSLSTLTSIIDILRIEGFIEVNEDDLQDLISNNFVTTHNGAKSEINKRTLQTRLSDLKSGNITSKKSEEEIHYLQKIISAEKKESK